MLENINIEWINNGFIGLGRMPWRKLGHSGKVKKEE
jgi:hypothetical protein